MEVIRLSENQVTKMFKSAPHYIVENLYHVADHIGVMNGFTVDWTSISIELRTILQLLNFSCAMLIQVVKLMSKPKVTEVVQISISTVDSDTPYHVVNYNAK